MHGRVADTHERLVWCDQSQEGPYDGLRPGRDPGTGSDHRQFAVEAPSTLLVADFAYVRLADGGFVYTTFVIDVFAG